PAAEVVVSRAPRMIPAPASLIPPAVPVRVTLPAVVMVPALSVTPRPAVAVTAPEVLLTEPLRTTSLVGVAGAASVTEPEPLAVTVPAIAPTVRLPELAVSVMLPLALVETPLTVVGKQTALATWPVLKPTVSVKLTAGPLAAKIVLTVLPPLVRVTLPP